MLILAVEHQSAVVVSWIKPGPTDEESVVVDLPLFGMVAEEAEPGFPKPHQILQENRFVSQDFVVGQQVGVLRFGTLEGQPVDVFGFRAGIGYGFSAVVFFVGIACEAVEFARPGCLTVRQGATGQDRDPSQACAAELGCLSGRTLRCFGC